MRHLILVTGLAASTALLGFVSVEASTPQAESASAPTPVTIAAPCDQGKAYIRMRLAHNEGRSTRPTMTLTVEGARPGSRWTVAIEEGPDRSVTQTVDDVRADAEGRWRYRYLAHDGLLILVGGGTSRDDRQGCELFWKGVFEPLPVS